MTRCGARCWWTIRHACTGPTERVDLSRLQAWIGHSESADDEVTRVERIEPKTGRSGQICFVTVRHEISSPRGLAVIEEQDIVFLYNTAREVT